jgi:phosphate transport system substrate-binding protein
MRTRHVTRRGLLAAAPVALWLPQIASAQIADEFGRTALRGAGSTFAHPLMAAWAREFRTFRQGGAVALPVAGGGLDDDIGGTPLDYEAVGSQAGVQRLRTRAVDMAVTEMPLPVAELRRVGFRQTPLVAGAVAVAANLPASVASLRLDGTVLADIYLGRVRLWSDSAIARLNPGVRLPDAPIAVLHRGDGSGTTYTFTDFLSRASGDWKAQVGSDLLVNWPAGEGAKGSSGLVAALLRTPHSIGYVNLQQVASRRLTVASVVNPSGKAVAPSAATVQAAVAAAPWDAAQAFATPLVNVAVENAYPIVAAVYAIVGDRSGGPRAELARGFVEWALTHGRTGAERLGYTALPQAVVNQALAALRA